MSVYISTFIHTHTYVSVLRVTQTRLSEWPSKCSRVMRTPCERPQCRRLSFLKLDFWTGSVMEIAQICLTVFDKLRIMQMLCWSISKHASKHPYIHTVKWVCVFQTLCLTLKKRSVGRVVAAAAAAIGKFFLLLLATALHKPVLVHTNIHTYVCIHILR